MNKITWKGSVLLGPIPPVLVSCGTPEEVAKSKKGYTPKFLKEELKG